MATHRNDTGNAQIYIHPGISQVGILLFPGSSVDFKKDGKLAMYHADSCCPDGYYPPLYEKAEKYGFPDPEHLNWDGTLFSK